MSDTEATLLLIGGSLYVLVAVIGQLLQLSINKPLPQVPPAGLSTRCGCGCYRMLTHPPFMLVGRCQAFHEHRAKFEGKPLVAEGALRMKASEVQVGDRVGLDGSVTVLSFEDAYDGTHVRFETDHEQRTLCCEREAEIDVFRDEVSP